MKMVCVSMTRLAVLALLTISGIVISGKGVSGQDCAGDIPALITQCKEYVQKSGPKTDPSPGCCNAVKNADVPCVCKHITKEIEETIDMEKVVYVAQFCGKPLAHGSKCGSYTVPI